MDQRAHANRNIWFRFKVVLFQVDTATENRQQTSKGEVFMGSLTQ
jgi:hypothetical protein